VPSAPTTTAPSTQTTTAPSIQTTSAPSTPTTPAPWVPTLPDPDESTILANLVAEVGELERNAHITKESVEENRESIGEQDIHVSDLQNSVKAVGESVKANKISIDQQGIQMSGIRDSVNGIRVDSSQHGNAIESLQNSVNTVEGSVKEQAGFIGNIVDFVKKSTPADANSNKKRRSAKEQAGVNENIVYSAEKSNSTDEKPNKKRKGNRRANRKSASTSGEPSSGQVTLRNTITSDVQKPTNDEKIVFPTMATEIITPDDPQPPTIANNGKIVLPPIVFPTPIDAKTTNSVEAIVSTTVAAEAQADLMRAIETTTPPPITSALITSEAPQPTLITSDAQANLRRDLETTTPIPNITNGTNTTTPAPSTESNGMSISDILLITFGSVLGVMIFGIIFGFLRDYRKTPESKASYDKWFKENNPFGKRDNTRKKGDYEAAGGPQKQGRSCAREINFFS
jgi:ribosomal protein L32